MNQTTKYGIAALILAAPSLALADEKPVGLVSQTHANAGTVNVAAQGFEKAAAPAANDDMTQASIGAGGMLTAGNVYALALNALADGRIRRGDVQGEAKLVGNLKHEDISVGSSSSEREKKLSIANFQAVLRGDYFLARNIAVFARGSYVYNYVLGEDGRVNLSPGLAYHIVAHEHQSLHVDLGYDFQKIWLSNAADPEVFHNGRLALGYNNTINSAVSFQADVEFLKTLSPWSSLPPAMTTEQLTTDQQSHQDDYKRTNFQVNGFIGLNTKLSDKFMFGLTLGFRHDNNPAPLNGASPNVDQRRKSTDINTSFNLIYTLF